MSSSIGTLSVTTSWHVGNVRDVNLHAADGTAKGVSVREVEVEIDTSFKREQALLATALLGEQMLKGERDD